MASQLVLYDFPVGPVDARWASFSPFVLEVERGLRLAGLSFVQQRVRSMLQVKQLNPLGQLPVLEIDGERVADSTRILHRIEQLAPGALTRGLDARGNAEAWLWEEFSDAALYPQVLAMRWGDDRGWEMVRKEFFGALPPLVRDVIGALVRRRVQKDLVARDFLRAGLPACMERLQHMLDALDARAPEDGFWVGSEPSVADLGLFAQLHSLRLPQTPWLAETVAQRTRLSRWLDRVDKATRAA